MDVEQTAFFPTLRWTLLRRQKKEKVKMCENQKIEKLADSNNLPKFYESIRRFTHGCETGQNPCISQRVDLATNGKIILNLCVEQFCDLLNDSLKETLENGEP